MNDRNFRISYDSNVKPRLNFIYFLNLPKNLANIRFLQVSSVLNAPYYYFYINKNFVDFAGFFCLNLY